jgi:hypothetical protein
MTIVSAVRVTQTWTPAGLAGLAALVVIVLLAVLVIRRL